MEGIEAEGIFKDPIVSDLPFVGCASERIHGEGYWSYCKYRFFGFSQLVESFL
ncbi:hypothetical protein BYT27DRAFT_7204040 [Phlegmacium glaucopus]|nr:hypothetical protein BYT27DRAFT_7204040 [Phlegmacium glaucopus]